MGVCHIIEGLHTECVHNGVMTNMKRTSAAKSEEYRSLDNLHVHEKVRLKWILKE